MQLFRKEPTYIPLHIADLIHFIGGVYDDKKWELFKRTDLFILPTHSENFGIVVAEVLACGTSVLTCNAPHGKNWKVIIVGGGQR